MGKKIITSPIGTAVYPFLEKPDTFKGQTHYKLGLELSKTEAEAFKAKLLEMIKDEKFDTKKPKLPIKDGREDGLFLIPAKSQYKPVVFDAQKNPLAANISIGGGSKVRFSAEVYNYGDGISLRLNQVQVVDLVERNANNCAFDDIEDGYVAKGQEGDLSALDI
jgi:hypothetical protein